MTAKKTLAGVALLAALATTPALAQAPQQLRGTIEKIDGANLVVKPSDGADVTVKLADNAKIFGVKAATVADVKPNDFIGVGAQPQPDGSQKAIQVTIFSESQRGTAPGFRPWDKPGTTMTNGTADSVVTSVNGPVVMVKYNGGQQKIIIGQDAKIRMYVVLGKSDLKPGAHISVFAPQKAPDGSLQTARINVGIGDTAP